MLVSLLLCLPSAGTGCTEGAEDGAGDNRAGKADDLNACGDGSTPTCEVFVDCDPGLVPEVVDGCFGDCVDPETCEPPLQAASCEEALLDGFEHDSALHQISIDDLPNLDDVILDPETAQDAIAVVASRLGCSAGDPAVVPTREPECNQIASDEDWTVVCFAPTSSGYFLLTLDFVETVNVLFNRWD